MPSHSWMKCSCCWHCVDLRLPDCCWARRTTCTRRSQWCSGFWSWQCQPSTSLSTSPSGRPRSPRWTPSWAWFSSLCSSFKCAVLPSAVYQTDIEFVSTHLRLIGRKLNSVFNNPCYKSQKFNESQNQVKCESSLNIFIVLCLVNLQTVL